MSSQQPSCELWMPCRKNEQSRGKRRLVALHIGLNTPQGRKPLRSAARCGKWVVTRLPHASAVKGG